MILSVPLPNQREYPIYLNEKKSFTDVLKQSVPASRYVVITNETIAELYASTLSLWEQDLPGLLSVVVEDGEQYKHLGTMQKMLDTMLEAGCDRHTVVIAFGGGVIGDMAGFASSLLLRGVSFVQVPTTLLAMVDSSVGGKTGVNHAAGKNLIGAFYQPHFVWIDTAFLTTLSDREYAAGCGEIAKYGYIGGKEMFDFVEQSFKALLARDASVTVEAIRRSVTIKAEIVGADEREQGQRALLNFGHTFGHALEHYYHYNGILHGEGVVWGIYCAVELAITMNMVTPEDGQILQESLKQLPLPALPSKPAVSMLYKAMFSDKKSVAGTLRFVVPTGIGCATISSECTEKDVCAVMEKIFS